LIIVPANVQNFSRLANAISRAPAAAAAQV
jgi:hypothetical protein